MFRSKRGKISIVQSILLHSMLLLPLLLGFGSLGTGDQNGPPQQQSAITAEIVDMPDDQEGSSGSVEDEGMEAPDPVAHATDDCKDFFGGIGITQSMQPNYEQNRYDAVVATVHHGYPAEKAGIQVGDVLLNDGEIRGEIGTVVVVRVLRAGELLEFRIVRDKICTEERTKP